MRRAALLSALLVLAGLHLAGCGREQSHEFSDVRDRSKPRATSPAADHYDRFRRRNPHGGDPHAGVPGMGGKRPKALRWTTPDGWEEVDGHSSREGTWRVKGEPQTECSLSVLRGTGGGTLANVNRWREQMGAAPIDAKALAELPRGKLLGAEAVYVSIPGRYTGMGGKANLPDARMLGLLIELPANAVYLKFVGPATVVEAQQGNFEKLAASVEVNERGGRTPPKENAGAGDRPEFAWTVPTTWETRQGRPGRVVTVGPKGAAGTQCYLYLLFADGGGIAANINRWRGQMGQKPLSTEEIAKLERIETPAGAGPVIQIDGPYRGMGAAVDGARFYGGIMLGKGYMLTATMFGPVKEVAPEWDNFLAFCKSVKLK